jgi:NAD(P)-dependent dehydrogenase (short-subunit alcohol dehydrogenase family)
VTIAFAREGADVLISYLNEHDDARGSADWVEKAGRRAVLMAGDVGDVDHCNALVKRMPTERELYHRCSATGDRRPADALVLQTAGDELTRDTRIVSTTLLIYSVQRSGDKIRKSSKESRKKRFSASQ